MFLITLFSGNQRHKPEHDTRYQEKEVNIHMKRVLINVGAVLLSLFLVVGCGASANPTADTSNSADAAGQNSGSDGKFSIVTTIFPEYDWTRNVVGESDALDVKMLLGSGVDLHSFQPTAGDILTISNCDMFVYIGGESNKWVTDALKESVNPDMIVVDLLKVLGEDAKEEEIVEGMQAEEEEKEESAASQAETEEQSDQAEKEVQEKEESAADQAEKKEKSDQAEKEVQEKEESAASQAEKKEKSDQAESENQEIEYDEHIWLSLRNAEKCVQAITKAVCELDPTHSDEYEANAASYLTRLDTLDKEYEAAVSKAPVKALLFGDRFPFRYMTEDYGLTYYAAFAGCSAETEASFETIIFLAEKTDELGIGSVMTIENSDQKIAKTIVQNTKEKNQKILVLNSMQAVTSDEIDAGEDYLSIMGSNLEVVKEALGVEQ
ncbi:MAG: metal ABC transporter solute-binding protein, Zn/Mn family [Bacteroidales bacterium]